MGLVSSTGTPFTGKILRILEAANQDPRTKMKLFIFLFVYLFIVILGLELRAYTLSHSLHQSFSVMGFSR
jgi:uncharacterized membrane protein